MSFLPDDFRSPGAVESELFLLRPITIHDVIKDYDAVMSSREHLWTRFGDIWGWPPPDLSLEQDLIDLAWHQKEAQLQSTFNYAVMSLDESMLLGCVYIDPPGMEATEADVWFWIRTSMLAQGLENKLESFVREWLKSQWPFQTVSLNSKIIDLGTI